MTDRSGRFDAIVVPHLDAAYNLARWLLRNDADAQDAVQESFLRALRFFDGLQGDDARPWLLGIVRNTCYSWMRTRGRHEHVEFDEERDSAASSATAPSPEGDPARVLARKSDARRIDTAIQSLPPQFREVIVLRELEDMSYDEIAAAIDSPLGTVMSRLARARRMLRERLTETGGDPREGEQR